VNDTAQNPGNTPSEPLARPLEPALASTASHIIIGRHRVGQFLRASIVAVLVGLLSSSLLGDSSTTVTLALVAVFLTVAHAFARRGRIALASGLMLSSMSALMCYQAFHSGGLHDEALTAFPALLIFASMFGTRKHFFWVLGAVIATLCTITAGNLMGWHANGIQPPSWMMLVNLLSILLVTAYFIWLMAADLRLTMARLRQENQRLSASLAQVDRMAHHDALTGLPNRMLARLRFEQALALAQRAGHGAAVIFLDLDNFKTINDSLGHTRADQLLRDVAARLLESVRTGDTVSRQGGDEFLVLLATVRDEADAAHTAGRILERLAAPFTIDGLQIYVTCSLGVALYPHSGADFDTLLKNADEAMYQAKDGGRNTYRFHDPRQHSEIAEALQLMTGLRKALGNGELRLHYQPQIDLASGRVVGAEALLRWAHPTLGMVAPARFIPLAERSGFIAELGRWVLLEACRQARQWQQDGLAPLAVAVNLSPVQFRRDEVERDVTGALASTGLAPQLLELELTESVLFDESDNLGAIFGRLRALGVRLAIDDFGTGYSNLGYLKRFAVQRLKIDRSFVRRLSVDAHDESIVRAIIDVAHNLGLATVAEGVEDEATLARLVQMGCEFAQGYLWAPALPSADFVEFVRARELVPAG
jgi:diguanylate cyclase (GGDEF)-like protein